MVDGKLVFASQLPFGAPPSCPSFRFPNIEDTDKRSDIGVFGLLGTCSSGIALLYDHCSHYGESEVREIQLKHAKATLSAVVDQAVRGNPAIITRHGRKEAVVLSFDEYEKLAHVPSFGRLLASFPGDEGDIPARNSKPSRAVDL